MKRLLHLSDRESPYSYKEIRRSIRNFYYIPESAPVVLDLLAIYPLLGIEYQQLFNIYAEGYSLISIAAFWKSIFKKNKTDIKMLNRNFGNRVVKKLITRIQWIMSLDVSEVDDLNYSKREKIKIQDRKGGEKI